MFWRRHQKTFPIIGRKIRFSFNGYGNRIVTDDGRSLPEAMMMVVEAWEKHQTMSEDKSLYRQLVLWNLGMVASIPLQMVTSLGAIG
jgi:hypothetical protein